jgi:hypothetical protein
MKRPSFAWLGLPIVLGVTAWAGCGNGSTATTTGMGGAVASASSVGGSVGDGGSGSTCLHVDGFCDLMAAEDCNCIDCSTTALCVPDQCLDDDTCDHLLDSCICPGCANDGICGDPGKSNCVDDGKCDSFNEGCHCKDCWTKDACAPRVAACAGGQPDGKCDRATEGCDCVDCEGTPLCVVCSVDHLCGPDDPCSCVDCATDVTCHDPSHCVDDGVCAIIHEGCGCNDCKDLPECAMPDGGTDAGNDAGADAGDGG